MQILTVKDKLNLRVNTITKIKFDAKKTICLNALSIDCVTLNVKSQVFHEYSVRTLQGHNKRFAMQDYTKVIN